MLFKIKFLNPETKTKWRNHEVKANKVVVNNINVNDTSTT